MSFNIMDLVQEQLGDQVKGQIGNLLGDQSSMTDAGLKATVPALLDGFTKRASVPGGADAMFDAVSRQDDGLLDNVGSMLGGGQGNSLIQTGTKLLSGLFGNSGLGSLAGILAGVTGLSKGNTGSLMGIVAPIIIGVIKRKVMGGGMNAAGMLDMLKGQQSNINAAMPMGLSDQLNSSGFLSSISDAASGAVSSASGAVGDAASSVSSAAGNVTTAAGNTVETATDVGRDTAAGGSSMFKKLIPIIGLALLGWLGWNFFSGSDKEATDEAVEAASTETTEAASEAASTAEETAEAATDAADVDVDGLTSDLNGMFDSAKSSLEGITDADSATAAVPQLTEMGDKLGGISDMMGQVPEAARGPLSGIVSTGISTLEPLIEKARELPGVGDIIDPVVTPILEKLKAMAG